VDEVLQRHYAVLKTLAAQQLVDGRYDKFRQMAQFFTE
jgi:acetyl-CoA carboxylase alpha subunit